MLFMQRRRRSLHSPVCLLASCRLQFVAASGVVAAAVGVAIAMAFVVRVPATCG